jgi:glycerol-1-phosphate dehydrogenase [NAD(P)+]
VRDWPRHRAALESLVGDPATLAAAIERSGAPARFSELQPTVSPKVARWALRNCHLMRDRFTVLDLRFFAGTWGDEDVESVLRIAAGLGAGL